MTPKFNNTFFKLIQEARHEPYDQKYNGRIQFAKDFYSYELSLAEQELTQTDNVNEINEISKKIRGLRKNISLADEAFGIVDELIEHRKTTGKSNRALITRLTFIIQRLDNPEKTLEKLNKTRKRNKEQDPEYKIKDREWREKNKKRLANTKDTSKKRNLYDEEDLERLRKRFLQIKQDYPLISNSDIYKIIAEEEGRTTTGIQVLFRKRIFPND